VKGLFPLENLGLSISRLYASQDWVRGFLTAPGCVEVDPCPNLIMGLATYTKSERGEGGRGERRKEDAFKPLLFQKNA